MIPRRRPYSLLGLLFLLFALVPASVLAQQTMGDSDDSFILQVNRPAIVATGDMVNVVVVIDDSAVIDGQVTDALFVVNGTATINGSVTGDIVVAEGSLVINDGATANNISLFRSDMTRAGTATVTGDITEQSSYAAFGWGTALFSVVFWIGTTIALLLAGLAVMAIFGRQMDVAVRTINEHPMESALSGLLTWVLIPILAILSFITIIGIPVGIGLLIVVIPPLALAGYVAAAYWLGLRVVTMASLRWGRYVTLLTGLVILALVNLLPWFGGVITFIATLFGTGAIVYDLYRSRRREEPLATAPTGPTMGGQAHA